MSEATFASHSTNESSSTSRMVQKTYVIHKDEQFVQTEKSVTSEQLGEVIGTIGPQSHGEGERTLESVTSFQPATKIYRIKGDAPEDKIAIQSWRSTGIGTTPVTRQGYFVFEKSRNVAKEDG